MLVRSSNSSTTVNREIHTDVSWRKGETGRVTGETIKRTASRHARPHPGTPRAELQKRAQRRSARASMKQSMRACGTPLPRPSTYNCTRPVLSMYYGRLHVVVTNLTESGCRIDVHAVQPPTWHAHTARACARMHAMACRNVVVAAEAAGN